jgi:hypothetical protein
LHNGRNGRLFPDHLAEAISSRHVEFVCIEKLHHFVGRSEPQKRCEDELKTIVDFTVGVFVHLANRIAHQTDRKWQSELTSLRFVEQTSSHACLDGVQFQLR